MEAIVKMTITLFTKKSNHFLTCVIFTIGVRKEGGRGQGGRGALILEKKTLTVVIYGLNVSLEMQF